jgi:beta-glucosidase-like glycosyl hydrolase
LYGANQGNANVLSFKNYIDHNTKGYIGSAKSNVGSAMISFSAINWVPNSLNSQFLLGLLREDIGFKGFTITDYDDIEAIVNTLMPRTFMNLTEEDALSVMVNAGVDMFMLSKKAQLERLFKHAKKNVERNYIPEVRL